MALRVFITGATGFLGGAVARALVQQGAEVHAVSRRTADRSVLDGAAIHWHEADILRPQSLQGVFRGADWVIHAAGRLGEAGVAEQEYRAVNVEGARNVLAAALALEVRPRVLHLSSAGVLGPTGRDPAPESAPFHPVSFYERSKAASEVVALEFAARGLPVVVARPGFVYGPGDRHVLRLFQAIQRGRFFYIGGGRNLCQPTYVDDAVAGMLACLRRGKAGEAYHLVGPRAVTLRELGDAIAHALGVGPPRWSMPRWLAMSGAAGLEALARVTGRRTPLSRTGVDFFSQDRVFSGDKARQQLGYASEHDLAPGIPLTVAWYRLRGWLGPGLPR